MKREGNIKIFEDTCHLCKNNKALADAIKSSVNNQSITGTTNHQPTDVCKYENPAKIVVSGKRSFETASFYKDTRVCVLNFASATNPGGGVKNGASAQEECLCRISTLYECLSDMKLWKNYYMPNRESGNCLYNDNLIYTPDVVVFKTDTANPVLMKEQDWYKTDVITCAAPNLFALQNKGAKLPTEKELLSLFEKRFSAIFEAAFPRKIETLVLGAFGCGAFRNPPRIVALAAKQTIEKYRYAFKTIEFAVYCNPKDNSNFRIFSQVLGKM